MTPRNSSPATPPKTPSAAAYPMRGQNPRERITADGVAEPEVVLTTPVPLPTLVRSRGGPAQRNASAGRRRHPRWVMVAAVPARTVGRNPAPEVDDGHRSLHRRQ